MSRFGEYAHYYDAVYRAKPYRADAAFALKALRRYRPSVRTMIDLGCGTGRHAIFFAKKKMQVLGVDQSPEMLRIAEANLSRACLRGSVKLEAADIRRYRSQKKFDAAVSLFHVMNYQESLRDLLKTFASVRSVLNEKGVFLFDLWNGRAVRKNGIGTRVRRIQFGPQTLYRISEGHLNGSFAQVAIKMFVLAKNGQYDFFEESHRLRIHSDKDIRSLLHSARFRVLERGEWLTRNKISSGCWSVYYLAQAR